ncbi:MAG: tetratricopeptide repeat protein [Myxococcota bacterium]|nr:tetratricopeptide repeat protein [Myxococcota bacterium]
MSNKGLWIAGLIVGGLFGVGCAGALLSPSLPTGAHRKGAMEKADQRWAALVEGLPAEGEAMPAATLRDKLEGVLRVWPLHQEALYNRALLARYGGEQAEALRLYGLLVEVDEDFFPGVLGMAHTLAERERGNEGLALLHSFVERHPAHLEGRLAFAELLLGAKDYEAATVHSRELLKRSPAGEKRDVQLGAYGVVARVMMARGRWAEARLVVQRVQQLWPARWEVQRLRAELELGAGNTGSALAALAKGLEQSPGKRELRTLLADTLLRNEDYSKAIPLLVTLSEEPRVEKPLKLALALAYTGGGQFEDAARVYRRLVEFYPRDPQLLWHFGELQRHHLKNYGEALEVYERLERIAPKWKGLRSALGEATELEESTRLALETRRRREALRGQVLEACAGAKAGSPLNFSFVGSAAEVEELAWEMVEEAQRQAQAGEGESLGVLVECAQVMVREGPRADRHCADMAAVWGQSLLEMGRWEEALWVVWRGLRCQGGHQGALELKARLESMLDPTALEELKGRFRQESGGENL